MLTRAEWLTAVARCAKDPASVHAVLVLRLRDLDALRIEFGYDACETILSTARQLLDTILRPVDRACALGDSSFALLLPALRSENHAALAAHRLVRAFEDELDVGDRVIRCAVAIGLTFLDTEACDPSALLREADVAALESLNKQEPLIRYHAERFRVEVPKEGLREAILRNQLEIWLQPIIDLRTNRIVSAESLARWNTERGWVGPARFVPVAERVDLIGDFTRWSLNTTLRHAAEARRVHPNLTISFNISPRVFVEGDIVEQVLSALRLWDVPPSAMMLEVTEGAVMIDPARGVRILKHFHAEGLGIAVDDFGIGFSSFTYLQQFPATELKIDQSFVRVLRHDVRTRKLVRSMIELAENLDLAIVGEGVEDQETMEVLIELGCHLVQGYHLGRPIVARDFVSLLAAGGALR